MTGAPETPPPTCIRPTMPNLVVRYVRAHEDPPEEMGSSRPVFRGHSRSSEPTRIDGYTYNFSIVINRNHGGPISYRFRNNRRFRSQNSNFFPCPRDKSHGQWSHRNLRTILEHFGREVEKQSAKDVEVVGNGKGVSSLPRRQRYGSVM